MNTTCGTMWIITIVITIITIGLYFIIGDYIKLGIKSLMTWRTGSINKLCDKYGQTKVIFCTFFIFFVGIHISYLIFMWVCTIAWTLGIWSPYQ